ncbi:GAL4-like Zn(II)2Cys6 (or C6 zinc) binuclear cluster DNA-binding domain [Rhizoctonia solani]|uniref:GAL4-like Zn(II)2Cys6 (Or C6 zinc) binuclear cluster DNA-binding domain n=1 Tax=Rhizoctonia solani TaxID=456999 RepID=A0A8H7M797_9AGAM|nr:GAL4-like Zn(II)2Cys6 (or C6 zinc) binuclear cluster DNA-binding domain [Rhizoctonia solani]
MATLQAPITTLGVDYPILPGVEPVLFAVDGNRNAMRPNRNVTSAFPLVAIASTRMKPTEPGPNCYKFVDRIMELENQIRLIEEQRSSSSTTVSEYSSDESSLRSTTSPGLSLGSSSPGSSRDTSRTPITPTKGLGSADDVFPAIVSPSSPSSAYSMVDIYPDYSKSTGPDPSSQVVSKLLDTFFQRHSQCGFELHLGRVMRALQPGTPEPLTPVLLNSMLLMGCYFAQEQELKMWENEFFERTKWSIEENITLAHSGGDGKYNSLHHVQAMSMFGLYYYFKGRLLEGHVHTAHATRLAVALGLHKLNSRIFHPGYGAPISKQPFGVTRWRPRDSIELGEAINLWWSCMDTELAGSTLNGLSPCVSLEDDITTVWPRLLSDFESGQPLPDDDYSVNSLLDPQTSSIVVSVSRDNVKSLIAKSYILMVWAAKLDIERVANHQGSEEWWIRFERCDQAINQFMMTMPPVRLSRNVEELAYLILVHTAIYCSQLQLHNALAEFELAMGAQRYPNGRNPDGSLGGISYARCNEACRATVLAAAIVADIDLSYMLMFIGIAWVCVAEVLIREIPRLRRSGFSAQALEKEQQLTVIETCMGRLVQTYPVLSLQLQQLQIVKAQQTFY